MTTPAPARRPSHTQWILALGGWTVFVWGQRIANVIGADDLTAAGRTWRLVVAVAFALVGLLLVGAVALRRTQRSDEMSAWVAPLAVGLAGVGSAWWLVRGTQILVGDWDVGFKVVHTVLALVVLGLSVMVCRTRGYASVPYG